MDKRIWISASVAAVLTVALASWLWQASESPPTVEVAVHQAPNAPVKARGAVTDVAGSRPSPSPLVAPKPPALPPLDCASPPAEVLHVGQVAVTGTAFCADLLALAGPQPSAPAERWRQTARLLRDRLVAESLVRQALTQDGLAVTDPEIDKALAESLAKATAAGQPEPTPDEIALVRRQLRARLELRKLIAQRGQADVTESAVQDAYAANPVRFGQPSAVTIAPYVLRLASSASPDEVAAGEAAARRFAAQVARGAEVERAAGESGLRPLAAFDVTPSESEPGLSAAVHDLSVGQWTGPVQTRVGWLVGRVTGVRSAVVEPLDKVRDHVRARLASEQERADGDAILDALRRITPVVDHVIW